MSLLCPVSLSGGSASVGLPRGFAGPSRGFAGLPRGFAGLSRGAVGLHENPPVVPSGALRADETREGYSNDAKRKLTRCENPDV